MDYQVQQSLPGCRSSACCGKGLCCACCLLFCWWSPGSLRLLQPECSRACSHPRTSGDQVKSALGWEWRLVNRPGLLSPFAKTWQQDAHRPTVQPWTAVQAWRHASAGRPRSKGSSRPSTACFRERTRRAASQSECGLSTCFRNRHASCVALCAQRGASRQQLLASFANSEPSNYGSMLGSVPGHQPAQKGSSLSRFG